MPRKNLPHSVKARRQRALEYLKKQLHPDTRSEKCTQSNDQIKAKIEILEAKLKAF